MDAITQYQIGNFRNFVYILVDWPSRQAAVVDPQEDLTPWQKDLEKHGVQLTHVLLTHTHFDHVAGVPEIVKNYPDVKLFVHAQDRHRLPREIREHRGARDLTEGEFRLGELQIQVLHTPGHSAGECCFFLPQQFGVLSPTLLTGDTLFIRECGRTDLPTGDDEAMFRSLQRIKALPAETMILPGHQYSPESSSTLRTELIENPALRCASVDELKALP